MSTKGTLTREQVVAIVGAAAVDRLERVNCEPTGRLQTDGDDSVEFRAGINLSDAEHPEYSSLTAYYYQSPENLQGVEDLSNLNWAVTGYELT